MYSQQLQAYIEELSDLGRLSAQENPLLQESLTCYLGTLAEVIQGELQPPADLLGSLIKVLSLSEALVSLPLEVETDGSHYLIGMGLEQSGELLARNFYFPKQYPSLRNDHWYHLTLALFHYMAGGHRVQALSVLRHLEQIASYEGNGDYQNDYRDAFHAIKALYSGKTIQISNEWERLIFGQPERPDSKFIKLNRLSEKIRLRRQFTLSELGQGNEAEFLSNRGITSDDAASFWAQYLEKLEERRITSFTNDQIGEGFDVWLRGEEDILVILPTGSGKTVIGELRTALALAQNQQVIWVSPTKSLLRQARRELSDAFEDLEVVVTELPTTEDFHPLFTEALPERKLIAATTPEKLAALIRSNPAAISNVGLVVLDEAHILFDINRGATAEYDIQEINQLLPSCKFVFMSAVQDDLERFRSFFNRLRGLPSVRELISDSRPTRRIYGVITNQEVDRVQTPILQIYPAGLQSEDGTTINPLSLLLTGKTLPPNPGPTEIAQSLLKAITPAPLRAVMFVSRIDSTETQSERVSRDITAVYDLPNEDIDRMRCELGRQSIVEATSIHGIAPHHSGLTRVEQHIVEKWTRQRIIKSVVATPTLAQGVNLPFDISIVSFLSRRDPNGDANIPLTASEVLNMVGRAGRAGQVSDGLCLIAMRVNRTPRQTLDSARRYFFHVPSPTRDFLGLARLMAIASNSHIDEENWLTELENMTFSQSQALVSFALRSIQLEENHQEAIRRRLAQYPSVQDLQEQFGAEFNVVDVLSTNIEPMIGNILGMCGDDREAIEVITRTGMPIEMVRFFLNALREDYDLKSKTSEQVWDWADDVVRQALLNSQNRVWFRNLIRDSNIDRDFNGLFPAIRLWRGGSPLNEIEQFWNLNQRNRQNKIWIGKFFNHDISLFAQFWGTLSICEEILFRAETQRPLENIQTYVREGVTTLSQLEWLYRLGGIDRVLAHRLAELTPTTLDASDLRDYTRQQFRLWKRERNTIPFELGTQATGALKSIFNDR